MNLADYSVEYEDIHNKTKIRSVKGNIGVTKPVKFVLHMKANNLPTSPQIYLPRFGNNESKEDLILNFFSYFM